MIKQLLWLALTLAALCLVPSVTQAQHGHHRGQLEHAARRYGAHAPVVVAPPRERAVVVAPPRGRVIVAPPPVLVHLPPPLPQHAFRRPMAPRWRQAVWMEGYWQWNGDQYVWIDGRWVRPRRGYAWVQPRWEERDQGWILIPGRWSPVH